MSDNREPVPYRNKLGDAAKLRESITLKSDPDWKDICAKCRDGDIEPKECEYYGEPNGCNSPIYGQHPKAKQRGDCAKLREALEATLDLFWDIHYANRSPQSNQAYAVIKQIKAALAAPPRNCDVGTVEQQANRFKAVCESVKPAEPHYSETGEVLCPSIGSGRECKLGICNFGQCALKWAQMPYKEGGAK